MSAQLDAVAFDESGESGRVRLPGFGLRINYMPGKRFPDAPLTWAAQPLTARETCMLNLVEQVTNQPSWNKEVFDEEIVARWKNEALTSDWEAAGILHGDFTEAMFDYVSGDAVPSPSLLFVLFAYPCCLRSP